MRKTQLCLAAVLFIGLSACNEKTKKDYHAEHDNFKAEIEEMKTKLDATEAQLLNVSAELSDLKNKFSNDSLSRQKSDSL